MWLNNDITHAWQKSADGRSLTMPLKRVSSAIGVNVPGTFSYIGTTLRCFPWNNLNLVNRPDQVHFYGLTGVGPMGIALYPVDGSHTPVLVAHPYSTVWTGVYEEASFASFASPDGVWIRWSSNGNLEGGPTDVYLTRMPTK